MRHLGPSFENEEGCARTCGLRHGQALIEVLLATIVLLAVLGGIVVLLASQGGAAAGLARDARARLLLDGELAYLRGLPAGRLAACEAEDFTPMLDVPRALDDWHFRRTIAIDREAGTARVELTAAQPGTERGKTPLRVASVIALQE